MQHQCELRTWLFHSRFQFQEYFSPISLSTCPGDQWPVWPHSVLGDGLGLTQIWGEMGDQRPGLITPVTGVTITWHRVKTDKTNLSKISNILKFFTHRKKLGQHLSGSWQPGECSVRRTSGTLLFYWHKDCFMWGQSDGPELLPYFGTKKSR